MSLSNHEESQKKDPSTAPQDDVRLAVDPKILFQEIERLENDYASTQLKNEQDKKIFQYYKGFELLRRLEEIQLTPTEFEAVKGNLQKLNTDDLADFVAKTANKPVVLFKRWERNIRNAIKFYELAQAGEQSLGKALDEFLKNKNEEAAVLVFGGFHKDGIKRILRSKNLSYRILTPAITSVSPRHQDYYKNLMSMGSYPFEVAVNLARARRAPSDFLRGRILGPRPVQAELRALSSIVARNKDLALPLLNRLVDEQLKPPPAALRSEVRTQEWPEWMDPLEKETLERFLGAIDGEEFAYDRETLKGVFIRWLNFNRTHLPEKQGEFAIIHPVLSKLAELPDEELEELALLLAGDHFLSGLAPRYLNAVLFAETSQEKKETIQEIETHKTRFEVVWMPYGVKGQTEPKEAKILILRRVLDYFSHDSNTRDLMFDFVQEILWHGMGEEDRIVEIIFSADEDKKEPLTAKDLSVEIRHYDWDHKKLHSFTSIIHYDFINYRETRELII